jgi:alcohol dehydrogenase class IV
MSAFDLARIPHITGGAGRRNQAGSLALAHVPAGSHVVLVADPGLKATGLADDVAASLKAAGLGVSIFSDFTGDPTVGQTDAAANLARETQAKAIVSLGGGSALDLGKAVAAIATDTLSAVEYELCKRPFPTTRLASIVIPTTSGTGSEVTRTSIVTRTDKAKVWLWGDELKADEVILDPETTVSLPATLTAWTGIDALIHAFEAATNGNATDANNVFAHEAIRLAVKHLPTAVKNGSDIAARAGLQRAAMLGGTSIDNCGTAAAHMIGHALASLKPLHHGRSVIIGIMASIDWTIGDDDGRNLEAARAFGLTSAADLPKAFRDLAESVGIDLNLGKDFAGISAETLAAQFARPENAAMRSSNRRKIEDRDLTVMAEKLLATV